MNYKIYNYDLSEARRAIESALHKSEKALLKLKQGTFSHTLTLQGIKAYRIALELIDEANEPNDNTDGNSLTRTEADMLDTVQFFESTIARVQKVLPKFVEGTPQHTLAVRRIRAFEIAETLIQERLRQRPNYPNIENLKL